MHLLCENEEVLSRFAGKNSLIDSEVEKFEISKISESIIVDVHFRMRPSSDWSKVRIRFCGCLHYWFNFSIDRHFYLVDRLKFFRSDDGCFYASFDPYDDSASVSEEDNDVVYSESIQAYLSN